MSGFKEYTITWTEEHKKVVYATSAENAIEDAKIPAGYTNTFISSKNFKVEE